MTAITPHGGYRGLASFQMAEIACDFTMEFCKKYIRPGSRTHDQMEQATRSGKQNIAEGSQASAVSPKTELKLVDVARASMEELKLDYEDFLRQHNLVQWNKNDPRVLAIRKLAYAENKSYRTYESYMTNTTNKSNMTDRSYKSYSTNTTNMSYATDGESAANCALCVINQTNYLLDKQLQSLHAYLEKRGMGVESSAQKATRILAEERKREKEKDEWLKQFLSRKKEVYDV